MEKFVKISKMDEFVKIPADFLEKLISSDDLTVTVQSLHKCNFLCALYAVSNH